MVRVDPRVDPYTVRYMYEESAVHRSALRLFVLGTPIGTLVHSCHSKHSVRDRLVPAQWVLQGKRGLGVRRGLGLVLHVPCHAIQIRITSWS